MATGDFSARIAQLLSLQKERSFMITGVLLGTEEVRRLDLDEDDPPVGAAGRYDGVPVFTSEDGLRAGNSMIDVYEGILYSYIRMGAVD